MTSNYTGRLAPSPTGLLHLGHAATFWLAHQRAKQHNGTLLLRNEDLDPQRSKQEFVDTMLEDLAWLGIEWTPPMIVQSERIALYRDHLRAPAGERSCVSLHLQPQRTGADDAGSARGHRRRACI